MLLAGLPAFNGSNTAGTGGAPTPTGVGVAGAGANSGRPSAASALMKTLSVRLHRGTEFIKDTVQKALVMSTPVTGPSSHAPASSSTTASVSSNCHNHLQFQESQSLKRKLSGPGGLMGCSNPSTSNSISSSAATSSSSVRQYILSHQQPLPPPPQHQQQSTSSILASASFLKAFTVAPTNLHRSASARKRNPSTDSLLMDLCLFKPIRPMPITPVRINKARGFELKKPKFVSNVNAYSDDDEDDDDDDEDDAVEPKDAQPLIHKPKLSTVTLPQHGKSAFVPMPYIETTSDTITTSTITTTKSSVGSSTQTHNTHTSGPGKPANKPKRRRRAPLLTAKRRRKAVGPIATAVILTSPAPPPPPPPTQSAATKRKATASSTSTAATAAKRSRRSVASSGSASCSGGGSKNTSTSPPPSTARPSPPMTRQRLRKQISASSNSSRNNN